MPVGTAFDGSPWVTAAQASGVVLGTLGCTAFGALLLRNAASRGMTSSTQQGAPETRGRTRLKPMQQAAPQVRPLQQSARIEAPPGLKPEPPELVITEEDSAHSTLDV